MRYHDLLDARELIAYTRTFNARARQLGRPALHTDQVRGVILDSGGTCGWCGVSVVGQAFELDHIIALVDRGAHTPENLVVACPSCNRQKASQPPLRFALALVAQRGDTTPTIQRILDHYQTTAQVQRGLFEDD